MCLSCQNYATWLQLTKEGWLQSTPEGEKPGGVVQLRNPQDPEQEGPVMIASKYDFVLQPCR